MHADGGLCRTGVAFTTTSLRRTSTRTATGSGCHPSSSAPYARRGFIDHQTLSFDAILKFIEADFLSGRRLDPRTDGRPAPSQHPRDRTATRRRHRRLRLQPNPSGHSSCRSTRRPDRHPDPADNARVRPCPASTFAVGPAARGPHYGMAADRSSVITVTPGRGFSRAARGGPRRPSSLRCAHPADRARRRSRRCGRARRAVRARPCRARLAPR